MNSIAKLQKMQTINIKENFLPQMVAIAEEQGMCFIFSDVQKIADLEKFNLIH